MINMKNYDCIASSKWDKVEKTSVKNVDISVNMKATLKKKFFQSGTFQSSGSLPGLSSFGSVHKYCPLCARQWALNMER